MTAPDTDTLIALAREGRIAVVPVEAFKELRHRWRDGFPFNEDSEEDDALDAALDEAPTLTPALLALAEERDRLREALTAEREACAQTAMTCLVEAARFENDDFRLGARAGRAAAAQAIRARALTETRHES